MVQDPSGRGTELASSSYRYLHGLHDHHASLDDGQWIQYHLLQCTSIPGETQWVKDCIYGQPRDGTLVVRVLDESFTAGQAVEFIGIKSECDLPQHEDGFPTDRVVTVPCLNAITFSPLTTATEFLGGFYKEPVEDIRAQLVMELARLVGHHGAELLLLSMISKTYYRNAIQAIGRLPINLILPENTSDELGHEWIRQLVDGISALHGRVIRLDCTIKNLNEHMYWPRDVGDGHGLVQSVLQVTPGTLMVVNEVDFTTGTLNQTGVTNVKALQGILLNQTLDYEFPYGGNVSIPTDVGCISISKGCKSILPHSIHVHVHPTIPSRRADADLDPLRRYVAHASEVDVQVDEGIAALIQDWFVEARKSTAIDQDGLSIRILLAKWIAASCGVMQLTMEHFNQAHECLQ